MVISRTIEYTHDKFYFLRQDNAVGLDVKCLMLIDLLSQNAMLIQWMLINHTMLILLPGKLLAETQFRLHGSME